MKKKYKIIVAAFAVCSLAATFAGLGALDAPLSASASASASAASVSALGELEWNAVSGATGYEIEYATEGFASETFFAEENHVDAGEALTHAAFLARKAEKETATVRFTVTPVLSSGKGTPTEYEHTFSQLIDMGYTTHDLAEYWYPASTNNPNLYANSAVLSDEDWGKSRVSSVYKNDLLTFGYQGEHHYSDQYGERGGADDNFGFHFQLFCQDGRATNGATSLYDIQMNPTWGRLYYGTGAYNADGDAEIGAKKYVDMNADTDSFGNFSYQTMQANTPYYISLGVFDTYDIMGDKIGETVYFNRDCVNGEKRETHARWAKTFYVSDLADAGITEDSYKVSSTGGGNMQYASIDRAIFGTYHDPRTNGDNATHNNVYLFSTSENPSPNRVYYDNTTEALRWSGDCESYEWRVGNRRYTRTNSEYVDIADVIEEYREQYNNSGVDYIVFGIRGIGNGTSGTETTYRLNLSAFPKERSKILDIADVFSAKFGQTDDPATMISDENISQNVGWLGAKCDALSPNTHLTFSFVQKEAYDCTSNAGSFFYPPIVSVGLFADLNMWEDRYNLAIFPGGQVGLSFRTDWITYWRPEGAPADYDSVQNPNAFWTLGRILPNLEIGKKYFVTFGVDEIYDISGAKKLADRLTVQVSVEEGMTRRLLGTLSYDNYEFDADHLKPAYTPSAQDHIGNIQVWFNGGGTETSIPRSYIGSFGGSDYFSEKKYDVYLIAGEKQLEKVTLSYGEYFDFRKYSDIELAGYTLKGWRYTADDETYRPIALKGCWNDTSAKTFIVETELEAIEYSITYSVGDIGALSPESNPEKYTTDSDCKLAPPEKIPQGYLFVGWYAQDDTDRIHKIENLKGCTGDLNLVAEYVEGYRVTIDADSERREIEWKKGDEAIVLTAPEIAGKQFIKWQILENGAYVDYTEDEIMPEADTHLVAVYRDNLYTVNYQTDAQHTNKSIFSVQDEIRFAPATKDGYFFAGWYLDEEFTQKIESTRGYTQNLTLYAKWIEDSLPQTIYLETSTEKSALPIPVLPEGASVVAKLYLQGSEEEIELEDGFIYTFNEEKVYTVCYSIFLATGEEINKESTLVVAARKSFTITVHDGDETRTITKLDRETISEADFLASANGKKLIGVYLDAAFETEYEFSAPIRSDLELYVKWAEEGGQNRVGVIVGCSVAGAVAAIAGITVGIVFYKKRKKKSKE